MAVILHGDGLSCFNHIRSHHHSHCHSHGQKQHQSYHNNNKANFEYKPLIDDSHDRHDTTKSIPTILRDGNGAALDQTIDVCSHLSPNHGHALQPINANGTARHRNSHNGQNDRTISDSCDFNVPINPNELISIRNPNASTICPVHQYVHRDSSEHTPIGSSDSEDVHEHRGTSSFTVGHHHNHSSYTNHSNHSHDFSSKSINIQAAVIHVVGDFIQSIGVFISAVIIKYFVS